MSIFKPSNNWADDKFNEAMSKQTALEEMIGAEHKYKDFITQPLTKGMFVPCDEDGNVLEEPLDYSTYSKRKYIRPDHSCEYNFLECETYRQAKERVLFEDNQPMFIYRNMQNANWTIEQAINNGVKLILI